MEHDAYVERVVGSSTVRFALLLFSFVILIRIEWHVGRTRGRQVFRGPDAVSNLLLGMAQLAPATVLVTYLEKNYIFIYEHYALFEIA